MNPVSSLEEKKGSQTSQENPLLLLQKHGQSIWLDYIRRNLITSGELKRLIDEDGLRGMTSNPSIFEKAIAGTARFVVTGDPRPEDVLAGIAVDGTGDDHASPFGIHRQRNCVRVGQVGVLD